MSDAKKIKALAKYLDISASEIEATKWCFEAEGREYLVLTDKEANEAAAENIKESVWAFNPEFLAAHTMDGVDADIIRRLQECYEDANTPLLRLIPDVDHFIADAVKADGRGHFLSGYGGEECEQRMGKETYFIYRTN